MPPNDPRRAGRGLMVATAASVTLATGALAANLGWMFFGPGTSALIAAALALGALATSLLAGILAALSRRWKAAAIVLGATLGALALCVPARSSGVDLFWMTRQERADALVDRILDDGRVHALSDGQRYHKILNEHRVHPDGEPPGDPDMIPLSTALAQEGLEPETYHELRRELVTLQLVNLEVQNDHVALVYDGMLDNLSGFLRLRQGAQPPEPGDLIAGCQLVALRPLGQGWYFFVTT